MAYPIYSPYNYAMGDASHASPTAVAHASEKSAVAAAAAAVASPAAAKAKLQSMKGSLKRWLHSRSILDDYVAGKRKPAPGFLRRPGVKPTPPSVVAQTINQNRYRIEQDLATDLHALLVQSGADVNQLPSPDVSRDVDAAAKLAAVVIESPLQGGGQAQAQGSLGSLWLVVIPVAGAVLILSQLIKSKADLAARQAELQCISAGACTDSGFWLKVASVAVVAWIAWDKFGVREAATKSRKKVAG